MSIVIMAIHMWKVANISVLRVHVWCIDISCSKVMLLNKTWATSNIQTIAMVCVYYIC